MKRWHKITVLAAGSLAVGAAALAATWPRWLEGYAETKAMAALGTKFDQVEHGSFMLTEDTVTVTDLVLSKEGANVRVDTLVVGFTPHWWDRRVVVDDLTASGGSVVGTVEGFKSLRGDEPRKEGPSRVDLSSVTFAMVEMDVDLSHGDRRVTGAVMVDADSLAGPFSVEFADAAIAQGDVVLVSAVRVRTTLNRDEVFPLEVKIQGLSTSVIEEIPIQAVAGTMQILDAEADGIAFDLTGETDAGQGWSFDGSVGRSDAVAQGHLTATDILPSQLPIADLPIDPEQGTFSVDLQVTRARDLVTARGHAAVRGVHIVHTRLARDPVVLGGDAELSARADLSTREVVVEDFTFQPRVGERQSSVKVGVKGRVLYTADPATREYEVEMHMGAQPCQEVLDAVPRGLVPGLQDFKLGGETTLDLRAVVKMADHEATVLEGGLDMDKCRIEKVPEAVEMLDGPFRHVIRMKSGGVAQVSLMGGHPQYASFDEISPAVAVAVLSTEDGGFWGHDGYRPKALFESLRRNVELGIIQRGGSTLTMQAVKNVLLTHERTLSRKLQELFLTWVVEKRLSKTRILEIYLNVVEFGPGIYGIAHAADHYFGKSPDELTSLEAAFMATLLPRPVERHEMWCRGALTAKHEKYVRRVHSRMLSKGRITREEYDEGEAAGVVFSRGDWAGEGACLADGRREAEGRHTQGAMSGLLDGL